MGPQKSRRQKAEDGGKQSSRLGVETGELSRERSQRRAAQTKKPVGLRTVAVRIAGSEPGLGTQSVRDLGHVIHSPWAFSF